MKGIIVSISGSLLFGVVYFLASQLVPLTGLELVGWRIVLIAICLTLFMILDKDWHEVNEIVRRLSSEKILWLALPLSSAIMGVQLWLFVWAPSHNEALNTSLGFFFLPLVLVATGRICFKERLSPLQRIACLFAALGVANQLWVVGSISWTTVLSGLGFAPYFALRRYTKIDNLGGLWFDSLIQFPFAISFILLGPTGITALATYPNVLVMLPFFGGFSALALIFYIWASRELSMGLFGLLSYLEPTLLMVVALLLGESINQREWLTFIGIWTAIAFLFLDGIRHIRQQRILYARQQT